MSDTSFNPAHMTAALREAEQGFNEGGVPIGSVLVFDNEIIGRGRNRRLQNGSVVLHAEMDALENAGRQPANIYQRCTLYTTLSPCPMCSGAIILYGIPRVVVGENRTFEGDVKHLRTHGVEVVITDDNACYTLLQQFVHDHPEIWNEDVGV